jgi:hypothetical protein
MFEQGNNYINVEVDQATQEHQVRMLKYAEMVTPVTHNIVCDGYFYHKAFISAEGHTLSVDYANKKVSCSDEALEFFTIKKSKKKFSCGEFGVGKRRRERKSTRRSCFSQIHTLRMVLM